MLGLLGTLVLVLLPGAWITFLLPLRGFPLWARLCTGAILAPAVVAAQFYAVRLLGLSFEQTSVGLVFLNLPAAYLIVRRHVAWPRLDRRAALAAGLAALVITASSAPFLLDPQKRLYTWEAWSQADVVYSLANGQLVLEDAELAGVRLSYPWTGHVYQAVLSQLMGSSPAENYIWSNLIWVILVFIFAGGLVAELGGNSLSRVTVAIWLSFGLNFVGAALGDLVPHDWARDHPLLGNIWGDNRYTPWLDKLVFFGQMWFALGLFIATIFVVIRPWPADSRRSYLTLTGLLLCALGLVYPVLLPPAVVAVAARGLIVLTHQVASWPRVRIGEVAGLASGILAAAVVTYAQVRFLTDGRASSALIVLNDAQHVRWAALESLVVLSPLLIPFAVLLRHYWRAQRDIIVVLGLTAIASCLLYALFDIPWYRNQYKFMFTAAVCLAPFPSLVLEPVLDRVGRWSIPSFAVLASVLAIPLAHNVYANTYTVYTRTGPVVDVGNFDLSLANGEPLGQLSQAIRDHTPVDTLVVVDRADVHLPTLTRRQLYMAPSQSAPHPGILITSEEMLTLVKGYPPDLLNARRATLSELFTSDQPDSMAAALESILSLHRPAALVVDEQHQPTLLSWIEGEGLGSRIYAGDGEQVWLIQADDRRAAVLAGQLSGSKAAN
jgi:hypothetical protein